MPLSVCNLLIILDRLKTAMVESLGERAADTPGTEQGSLRLEQTITSIKKCNQHSRLSSAGTSWSNLGQVFKSHHASVSSLVKLRMLSFSAVFLLLLEFDASLRMIFSRPVHLFDLALFCNFG